MPTLLPHQILIRNLGQKISKQSRLYMTRDHALKKLKEITYKDFGYDIDAWQEWISQNKEIFIGKCTSGENEVYELCLKNIGMQRLKVLHLIRKFAKKSLKEIGDIKNQSNMVLMKGTKFELMDIAKKFKAVGADVKIVKS